jgi:hypothetical protein
LHYAVADAAQAEKILLALKCMENDPPRRRWVWLHVGEAGELAFFKSPPSFMEPIVLGEFRWKGGGELVLNTRSIERALAAVEFFDQRLPLDVARLAYITIVTRLFSAEEMLSIEDLHEFFERTPTQELNPEAFIEKIYNAKAAKKGFFPNARAFIEIVEEIARQKPPEMEKIPTDLYGEEGGGLGHLSYQLRIRQTVAYRHWQGNTDYTALDAVRELMREADMTS